MAGEATGAPASMPATTRTAPSSMDARQELLLLQICDSVFPIGAYSHSYGLETYIQLGIVHDESSAWEFVEQQLRYPLAYTELLGMRLAYDAALTGELARIRAVEALLAAARVPAETRLGSQRMAARFCKTVAPFLAGGAAERFAAYAAGEGAGAAPGGLTGPSRPAGVGRAPARPRAPHMLNAAYGVFAALAGIDRTELLRRWLYGQVSAMVANCVKTVPLSQTAGQGLLFRSGELQVEAVRVAQQADESLLGLSMPGFDVRCIEHETLYSRLYMS